MYTYFMIYFIFLGLLLGGCGNNSDARDPRVQLPDSTPKGPAVPVENLNFECVGHAQLGECIKLSIKARDKDLNPVRVAKAFEIHLDAAGKGHFFATPSCANPFGLGEVTRLPIIVGNSERDIYFKTDVEGEHVLTASAGQIQNQLTLQLLP